MCALPMRRTAIAGCAGGPGSAEVLMSIQERGGADLRPGSVKMVAAPSDFLRLDAPYNPGLYP
jgi:hypothetical protein